MVSSKVKNGGFPLSQRGMDKENWVEKLNSIWSLKMVNCSFGKHHYIFEIQSQPCIYRLHHGLSDATLVS